MSVVQATQANFESLITGNDIVILDFWAPWCGPCRTFGPIFETVAEQFPEAVFAKVNTEEEQMIAAHFGIRSIPTLMAFREQILVFNQAGALPASALTELVRQVQALDMDAVRREIEAAEKN
ncbi:MAG: thioredoxin [Halothiobacillaceae bacterium]|jgi:thioredoxin|nr:thioredoxin [Halothiobacillaceae bacterium]